MIALPSTPLSCSLAFVAATLEALEGSHGLSGDAVEAVVESATQRLRPKSMGNHELFEEIAELAATFKGHLLSG